MPLLDYVLETPGYGWEKQNGELVKPTATQILKEFFSRLNIFKSKKAWLPFFSWLKVLFLFPFFILFELWMFFYYLMFAPALVKKPRQQWK